MKLFLRVLRSLLICAVLAGVFSGATQSQASPEPEATTQSLSDHWDCWSPQDLPDACQDNLQDVMLLTSEFGWAVGDRGVTLQWDGAEWDSVQRVTTTNLRGVDALSPDDAWAVGIDDDVYHWDGNQWNFVDVQSFGAFGSSYEDIDMLTSDDAWAVGSVVIHWDGNTWEFVDDPITGLFAPSLTALHMLSANDGWAVGESGSIIHWDGNTWNIVPSPVSADLQAISMLSPVDGWIVGGSHVLHWDGVSWTEVDAPEYLGVSYAAISMVSPTQGWIVGYYSAVCNTPCQYSVILHWDGNTWSNAGFLPTPYLRAVATPTSDIGWMVGNAGVILEYSGEYWSGQYVLSAGLNSIKMLSSEEGWAVGDYRTILNWDGENWRYVPVITNEAEPLPIREVDATASNDAWAAGYTHILHWDGSAWREVYTPDLGDLFSFTHLDTVSASNVWAIGTSWPTSSLFHWDGVEWQVEQAPTGTRYEDLAMLDSNFGLLIAKTATNTYQIMRWDGAGWQNSATITSPYGMKDIEVVSPTNAWILSNTNLVYRWDGSAWTQSILNYAYNDLELLSADSGMLVGYLKSATWNGADWSTIHLPTAQTLTAVDLVSATDGWAVGGGVIAHWDGADWSLVSRSYLEDNNWADLSRTPNGSHWLASFDCAVRYWNGETWYPTAPQPVCGGGLNFIYGLTEDEAWIGNGEDGRHLVNGEWDYTNFPDQHSMNDAHLLSTADGWAVGKDGKIFRWNGTGWQFFSTPVTEDLYALEMLAADNGWAVGAGRAILHWDGASWVVFREPQPLAPGVTDNPLLAVDLLSPDEGWAVGALCSNSSCLPVIEHWDGSTWTEYLGLQTSGSLRSVSMAAPNDGWAVGYRTLLHWDGSTWSALTPPIAAGETLERVLAFSTKEAWITLDGEGNGRILRYLVPPAVLSVDHTSGSPGSVFTFSGVNFTPAVAGAIQVNDTGLSPDLTTDEEGGVGFQIDTTGAQPGYYIVRVETSFEQAVAWFYLAEGLPVWEPGEPGASYDLPPGIAYTNALKLPLLQR